MTSVDRIQGLSGSLAVKAPCRAATTVAITLAGEQTIDGIAVVTGDRVLVKNQATSSANGIYVASTAGWTRARDFDGNNDIVTGTLVTVNTGTVNGSTAWRVTTTGAIVVGTSALTFSQAVFSGSGSVEFTQAGANAVATTVQAKLRETFSVKDFGAVGNGIADDTTAIQRAINAAAVAGGGQVHLPTGTYLVSATLQINYDYIGLVGAGTNATVIKRTGDYGNTITMAKAAAVGAYLTACRVEHLSIYSTIVPTNGAHIYAEYADYLILDDLNITDVYFGVQIKGCASVFMSRLFMKLSINNPTSRRFIQIGNTTAAYAGVGAALHSSNIYITNSHCCSQYTIGGANAGSDYGVQITGCDGLWIRDSYFGGCSAATILINNATAYPTFISGVSIVGCWLDAGQGIDILIQGTASAEFGNFLICDNTFGGGTEDTYGIWLTGNPKSTKIANNQFYGGNKNTVIYVNCSGFVEILGNRICKGNVAGAGNGIDVVAAASTTICGNTIGLSTDTIVTGISIRTGTTNTFVTSNSMVNCTTSGITIDSGADYLHVEGNYLQNNVTALVDNSGDVTKRIESNFGYNPINPVAITVTGSPFTWKNTTGASVVVILTAGTVSSVALQGIQVLSATGASLVVPHGQAIVVTYTVAPTMKYLGA